MNSRPRVRALRIPALAILVTLLGAALPVPPAQSESGQKSSVGSKVTEVLKEFEALDQ